MVVENKIVMVWREMSYSIKVASDNHTHFSILHKEYIERDEYAEVEDINTVLHSHLCKCKKKRKKKRHDFDIREQRMFQQSCVVLRFDLSSYYSWREIR